VQQIRGERVAGQKYLKGWTGEAARSLSLVAELMVFPKEGGKKVPRNAWLPIFFVMRLWVLPDPSLMDLCLLKGMLCCPPLLGGPSCSYLSGSITTGSVRGYMSISDVSCSGTFHSRYAASGVASLCGLGAVVPGATAASLGVLDILKAHSQPIRVGQVARLKMLDWMLGQLTEGSCKFGRTVCASLFTSGRCRKKCWVVRLCVVNASVMAAHIRNQRFSLAVSVLFCEVLRIGNNL
jgi:hypothetical protein